jgi:hypothetical protein
MKKAAALPNMLGYQPSQPRKAGDHGEYIALFDSEFGGAWRARGGWKEIPELEALVPTADEWAEQLDYVIRTSAPSMSRIGLDMAGGRSGVPRDYRRLRRDPGRDPQDHHARERHEDLRRELVPRARQREGPESPAVLSSSRGRRASGPPKRRRSGRAPTPRRSAAGCRGRAASSPPRAQLVLDLGVLQRIGGAAARGRGRERCAVLPSAVDDVHLGGDGRQAGSARDLDPAPHAPTRPDR